MTYNAAGQRMAYSATGAGNNLSESFLYRGGELAQVTTSGSQNTTDTYLYRRDGTPLELIRTQSGATHTYWYEVDGRGNVIALTDSTGNTVDRYAYDLWGKPITVSESVPQRLRYTGSWYDVELGWYWLTTRAYDPVLERFLQPDPSQQEGIFTYVYSGDDPVDYNDKSGMDPASDAMQSACADDPTSGACMAAWAAFTSAAYANYGPTGPAALAAEADPLPSGDSVGGAPPPVATIGAILAAAAGGEATPVPPGPGPTPAPPAATPTPPPGSGTTVDTTVVAAAAPLVFYRAAKVTDALKAFQPGAVESAAVDAGKARYGISVADKLTRPFFKKLMTTNQYVFRITQVDLANAGLDAVQVGQPGHYEIVMSDVVKPTLGEYQEALLRAATSADLLSAMEVEMLAADDEGSGRR